jgi:serine/threonine-protein kinase RsbW
VELSTVNKEAPATRGPIVLTLPADSRMARVARLTASALGSLLDFSVDDIDDLRIGVDELVVTLIELGKGEPISLRFDLSGGRIDVRGETPASDAVIDRDRFALSERILEVVSDEYDMAQLDGTMRVTLVKQAAS